MKTTLPLPSHQRLSPLPTPTPTCVWHCLHDASSWPWLFNSVPLPSLSQTQRQVSLVNTVPHSKDKNEDTWFGLEEAHRDFQGPPSRKGDGIVP